VIPWLCPCRPSLKGYDCNRVAVVSAVLIVSLWSIERRHWWRLETVTMNRPLVWVAGSFALGIVLSYGFWVHEPRIAVLFGLVAAAWLVGATLVRGSRWTFAAVLVSFMTAGAVRYAGERYVIENDPLRLFVREYNEKEVTVEGTVLKAPLRTVSDIKSSFIVSVRSVEVDGVARQASGRAVVYARTTEDVRPGDVIIATGSIKPPRDFGVQTGPTTNYMDRIAAAAAIETSGSRGFVVTPAVGPRGLRGAVFAARRRVLRLITASVPEEASRFLAAAWLGENRALPFSIRDTLMRTGTYHVACVSGIHLAIVAAIVAFVLQSLDFSRRKEAVWTIAAIAFFAVMAGLRLPVCRAAFMLIMYYTAHLFRREGDPLSAMSLAAIVLLTIQPLNLFNAGFQLSFLSVFTVIMMHRYKVYERATELTHVPKILVFSFLVSAAIWVVTLPIVMGSFQLVSFVSPFANVFATPMMVPILSLTATATAVGIVWPTAAIIFNNINWLLITGLLYVLRGLELIPFSYAATSPPWIESIMLYYAAVLTLVGLRRTVAPRRRRLPLAAALLGAAFIVFCEPWEHLGQLPYRGPWPQRTELRLTFIDVGQGDSTLIEFPKGRKLLVDAGPASQNTDAGRTTVVPYLRRHGIGKLDAVVLTHPHNDHVGGMASVIDTVSVGKVFSTGVPWNIPAYDRFVEAIRANDIPHETLRAGDRLLLDDEVTVEALHPTQEDVDRYEKDPNNTSIVLRITYREVSVLLTGDIESVVERHLIERGVLLEADVLKVPHNGSANSSLPEFLDAVQPYVAVLPVGRNNPFGFPSPALLGRYRDAGITLLRTDTEGTVIVETDGANIRWRTATDRRGGYDEDVEDPAAVEVFVGS